MPIVKATTGQDLLTTEIRWFDKQCLVVCDRRCDKAWGHNGHRPAISESDDADNIVWLADTEVGIAPIESQVLEGGDGKPTEPPAQHNKWCVRECERSNVVRRNEIITCLDWSKRVFNQPSKHILKANAKLTTGIIFN